MKKEIDRVDYFILQEIRNKGGLNKKNKDQFPNFPYYPVAIIESFENISLGTMYIGKLKPRDDNDQINDSEYHILSAGGWVIGRYKGDLKTLTEELFYKLLIEELIKNPDKIKHIPDSYFNKKALENLRIASQKLGIKSAQMLKEEIDRIEKQIEKEKSVEENINENVHIIGNATKDEKKDSFLDRVKKFIKEKVKSKKRTNKDQVNEQNNKNQDLHK